MFFFYFIYPHICRDDEEEDAGSYTARQREKDMYCEWKCKDCSLLYYILIDGFLLLLLLEYKSSHFSSIFFFPLLCFFFFIHADKTIEFIFIYETYFSSVFLYARWMHKIYNVTYTHQIGNYQKLSFILHTSNCMHSMLLLFFFLFCC